MKRPAELWGSASPVVWRQGRRLFVRVPYSAGNRRIVAGPEGRAEWHFRGRYWTTDAVWLPRVVAEVFRRWGELTLAWDLHPTGDHLTDTDPDRVAAIIRRWAVDEGFWGRPGADDYQGIWMRFEYRRLSA